MNPIDVILYLHQHYEDWTRALEVLQDAQDPAIRWILINDASQDLRIASLLEEHAQRHPDTLCLVQNQHPQGFANSINQAIRMSETRDVLIIHHPLRIHLKSIEALQQAAHADSQTGAVFPLSNANDSTKALKLSENLGYDTLNDFVDQAQEIPSTPPVDLPYGLHALYLKREIWNLLQDFNTDYQHTHYSIFDYCLRLIQHGLKNQLCPKAIVYLPQPPDPPVFKKTWWPEKSLKHFVSKYPFAHDWIENFPEQPLQNLQAHLKAHLSPLSICIDGRCLQHAFTGTQHYVSQLIHALCRKESPHQFSVLIANHKQDEVKAHFKDLENLPTFVELAKLSSLPEETWDVFHRPYQANLQELKDIQPYFQSLVITVLDLIAYKNPFYFKNHEAFKKNQQALEEWIEEASGVLCISEHVKQELMQHFPQQQNFHTTYLGAPEAHPDAKDSEASQEFLTQHQLPQDYILYLGTDFPHKNILGALRLYEQLVRAHDIPEHFVIAGPHADFGNLKQAQEIVEQSPLVKSRVHFLGNLSHAEVSYAYQNAALFWYLSLSEGFGIPPLEAFRYDCPVIASKQSSIPEVVGDAAICIPPGDFAQLEAETLKLLNTPHLQQQLTNKGKQQLKKFDWNTTAQQSLKTYLSVVAPTQE